MITLPRGTRSDPLEGGSWWPLQPSAGGRSAVVSCPGCGRAQTLTDHTIAPDGVVSPSLQCHYHDDPAVFCWFHDHVQLLGWEALD